ncbi:MAG TPA: hypothetical protein VFG04_11030 [Planctomycetaceae bacterium]|nr:hypothetical protein [Planctomycetaceae bacterium]
MTRIHGLRVAFSLIVVAAVACPCVGQITPADVTFARLSSSTVRMAYVDRGGDMTAVQPLLDAATRHATDNPLKAYRDFTHAMTLMNTGKWTPESELATALDFAIDAKVISDGEPLHCRATFLFDAPAAATGPYHLELTLLKPGNIGSEGQKAENASSSEKIVATPGIVLGDVKNRREGETVGLIFVPSKHVGPGLHLLRATLKNGKDEALYEYYRTFFLVDNLKQRFAAAQKTVDLLPEQTGRASASARYLLDTIRLAQLSYLGGAFQNLTGYLHTAYRARGFALAEMMDFDAALDNATKLATELKEGRDPLASATGDLRLAYRSTFDGKLVPYRVYVPSNYSKSKACPLITLLHGAGGDENNFFDRYEGRWPRLAEERGYIIVAVNGRGPLSGYQKANGAERDVLDVTALVQKDYNVDRNRVYLAGHSMGSAGTWLIGLTHRDQFAALALIAGSRMSSLLETALKSGPKIPLIIVAGVKDALVPVAGCRAVAQKAKELGYDVKYLEYPEGDHISVAVTSVKEIFDFFDAHRRSRDSAHGGDGKTDKPKTTLSGSWKLSLAFAGGAQRGPRAQAGGGGSGRRGGQGALTRQIMLNLTDKDGKISGDFVGFTGKPAPIRDVKLKEGELSFKAPQQMGPNTFTIDFVAKLSGAKMQGTAKIATPAGAREFPFEGERLKTPTVSAAGTWKLHIVLREGPIFDPTVKLTEVGNALKGVYIGEQGETSVSNALVFGEEVTFDVARDRDGKKYRLHFQGKVKGNALNGTVDYDFDGMTGYVSFTGERAAAPQASADKTH